MPAFQVVDPTNTATDALDAAARAATPNPCPICGAPAEVSWVSCYLGVIVSCVDKSCRCKVERQSVNSSPLKTLAKALKAWNAHKGVAPKTGASLNRHKSESTVVTPMVFVDACEARYGCIRMDLAATKENSRRGSSSCYTVEDDAFSKDWEVDLKGDVGWLNPPYGDIGAWAKKADAEAKKGARVVMLVPASVGSNWYRDYIHFRHPVDFINGRIMFDGHDQPYPKDLMVVLFGFAAVLGRVTPNVWTVPRNCLRSDTQKA